MITSFNTGPNSEKTETLPISVQASTKRSIFWLGLGALDAGDILQINAFFQVSNPQTYNVMCGKYLTLNDGSVSHGYAIHSANVRNVTPDMHHDVPVLCLAYEVPESMSNAYLTLVAYAAASQAQSGHTLTVDQGKGRLSGLIIRP